MSVSNLPFETQVLMPPSGGKWITENQKINKLPSANLLPIWQISTRVFEKLISAHSETSYQPAPIRA